MGQNLSSPPGSLAPCTRLAIQGRVMDGDQVTAPSPEHVRSSSWGGPEARAELRRIADDARLRSGFVIGSFEVLRADGFLELVAFTGRPEEHASMGGSFSLALARRVLRHTLPRSRRWVAADERRRTRSGDGLLEAPGV